MAYKIDGLQYANWSGKIFEQMQHGRLDCVHATIAYHENFREAVLNLEKWNSWFERYPDRIIQAHYAEDISEAKRSGKTAIIFGFQTPAPIEDDIGLVEIWHRLGMRIMQLTYNNQSLLATGCYEVEDSGITRMGREVIAEMNRLGLIIDMSHSSQNSTLQAIEHSNKPIAITHANPNFWHHAKRNKSDVVLKSLSQSGGMLGFSIYPHHLKNASNCSLQEFCDMIAKTADLMGGTSSLGIGSDLCQNHPDSIVEWMRNGRWTKTLDYGEGSSQNAGFPKQPDWFMNNSDFPNLEKGLLKTGFSQTEIDGILGNNWYEFFKTSFGR
ncbi:MAG: membrane dipeptidase [Alphaproteobacteria bacterium]